jgi:hypothetical protein
MDQVEIRRKAATMRGAARAACVEAAAQRQRSALMEHELDELRARLRRRYPRWTPRR